MKLGAFSKRHVATVTQVEYIQVVVEPVIGKVDNSATTTQPAESSDDVSTDTAEYYLTTAQQRSHLSSRLYSSTTTTTTTTTRTMASGPVMEADPFNQTQSTQLLDAHNEHRRRHHAQALKWNSTLYEYAKDYANNYSCSGILTHSGGPYGENLAIGYTPLGAVSAWYDEIKEYVFGTETTYSHFTQVVWNNTATVGCATKYCNAVWGLYLVCSYYPQGNVIGESLANVFPIR